MEKKDLSQIAKENEHLNEKKRNPYKTWNTIPIQVKDLLRCQISSEGGKKCKIEFQTMTSEEAILHYRKEAKLAVLNFADRKLPGGYYLQGAQTQEEALCRSIPGLYPSLCASNCYPYNSYETFMWSPKMWFQRDATNEYKFLKHPIPVSVISSAAPDLSSNEVYKDKEMKQLIEALLLCPFLLGGCNVLILGCFGTGAFKNDPVVIAKAFAHGLQKYKCLYKRIVFAIPESKKLTIFQKEIP